MALLSLAGCCSDMRGTGLDGSAPDGVSSFGEGDDYHPEGWASPSSHGGSVIQFGLTACLECHKIESETEEEAPTCYSCHPLFPHAEDWGLKGNHGAEVLANGTGACATQCHGIDLKGGLSGVSCNRCHVVYPHDAGWADPAEHGESAKGPGASRCRACHGEDLQGGASGVSCYQCHSLYPHEPDWRERDRHGAFVLMNGTDACATPCHGIDFKGGLSGVACASCHNYPHSAGWEAGLAHGVDALSADPLKNVANCKLCHGAGLDKAPPGYLSCKDCHSTYPPHDSAGLGGPPWRTIHSAYGVDPTDCKKCHGDDLNGGISGVSCNDCHATNATCIGCHGSPKDNGDGLPPQGRRPVVGEFPTGAEGQHAHHGGTLDNGDCVVCHVQTTHMNGQVDLVDPDDAGTIYSFMLPEDLSSDPDLSDFCMHCHDEDGATRLAAPLDPFGNGNAPPDVASRFKGTLQWKESYGDVCFGVEGTERGVNSHHDVSDADQAFSGAKIECLNCHGAHSPSAARPIVDPYDPLQVWAGTTNEFCLSCHGGGLGPADPNMPAGVAWPRLDSDPTLSAIRGIDSCDYTGFPWYVDVSWSHAAHGPGSKRSWTGYSGAPATELDCLVCHDEHGSYSATNTPGNPYMIRDYVDGTSFVDDGVRPAAAWTGPPWDTMGGAGEVEIPVSGINVDWGGTKGLCNRCHATWLNAYSWHSFCTGCQTCHGHGQAWGAVDLGASPDDTPWCP